MEDPSDTALVAGLRRREQAAFDAVYARYHARIHRFLLRLSGRRHVAEDLFQEAWLSVARSAGRLAEDTDLCAWLFTVARNRYRSYRRWALLDTSRLAELALEPEDPAPCHGLACCTMGLDEPTHRRGWCVQRFVSLGPI